MICLRLTELQTASVSKSELWPPVDGLPQRGRAAPANKQDGKDESHIKRQDRITTVTSAADAKFYIWYRTACVLFKPRLCTNPCPVGWSCSPVECEPVSRRPSLPVDLHPARGCLSPSLPFHLQSAGSQRPSNYVQTITSHATGTWLDSNGCSPCTFHHNNRNLPL